MERMKEAHSSAGKERKANGGAPKAGEQEESPIFVSLCVGSENKEALVWEINLP